MPQLAGARALDGAAVRPQRGKDGAGMGPKLGLAPLWQEFSAMTGRIAAMKAKAWRFHGAARLCGQQRKNRAMARHYRARHARGAVKGLVPRRTLS
jgi:hypothetical protein